MSSSDESNRLLIELGCTALQTKVYLNLLALQNATAKTLAKKAHIARAETYRVLNELQEKKLIEKIIAAPTEFRAIPLSDCLELLVNYKREEALRLQRRSAILLKKFNEERKTPAKEPTFRLIKGKKRLMHLLANYILGAKESIDVMTTSERFIVLRFFLEKYFVERATAGVKLRFLLERKGNEQAVKEHQQLMAGYHSVGFRYARLVDQVCMIIFDEESATIVTSLEENPFEAPCLFTTSPPIVHALEVSYDVLWKKAENLIPP